MLALPHIYSALSCEIIITSKFGLQTATAAHRRERTTATFISNPNSIITWPLSCFRTCISCKSRTSRCFATINERTSLVTIEDLLILNCKNLIPVASNCDTGVELSSVCIKGKDEECATSLWDLGVIAFASLSITFLFLTFLNLSSFGRRLP